MISEAELARIRNHDFPQKRYRSPLRPLTPAQQRLREMVYRQISDEPGTFDMDDWECKPATGEECDTVRCVGGWAAHLAGISNTASSPNGNIYMNSTQWEALGVSLLGLTEAEYIDDDNVELFYSNDAYALERMAKLAAG